MATSPNSLRPQRVAEMVANELRDEILQGVLADGDTLPKEQELRERFPVAKTSLREAMRILETEGLVTVRRGNVGGAVVHRPTALNVAQTLGVVLVSRRSDVLDVARAIREVEPACAALCATRKDRRRKVVPPLMRLQKQAMASLDDLIEATRLSRQFHETMVQLCGNQTLIVLVGALEAVWSSHENTWAHRAVDPGDVPVDNRREALLAHDEMIGLIDAGDEAAVRGVAAEHLSVVQRYPTTGVGQTRIDLSALRGYIER